VRNRAETVRSWYLDVGLLESYWGDDRSYHHTAPITAIYGLREALRLVAEEGIEERWTRHLRVAGGLKAGVEAMGLRMNPQDEFWLPSLNAVRIPEGVDAKALCRHILFTHGIEIAGGLGDLAGKIIRIGCMGHSAQPRNVLNLLPALADGFAEQDVDLDVAAGLAASAAALEAD